MTCAGFRRDSLKGPDGLVYTRYDDLPVRLDPATKAVTALSKVSPPGHIAFVGRDREEFRRLLRKYGLEWDEQYVWD